MAYYPANKRYAEKNLLKVTVSFNRKTEPQLVERVEQEEKRAAYLKRLVKEDEAAEIGSTERFSEGAAR